MKTVSVALILCLNVGVDPPDVVKTQPCARLECWIGISLYLFKCFVDTLIERYFCSLLRSSINESTKSFGSNWHQSTETVREMAAARPLQANIRPDS